jgi:hypothetical protein
MAAPLGFTLTNATVGGSLPATKFYVVVTCRNLHGETLPAVEASVTTTTSASTVTASMPVAQTPFGASTMRAYYGFSSGAEGGFLEAPIVAGTATQIILTAISQLAQGLPPTRPTAFMPDTDGSFLSVGSIYSLFNRAQDAMVRIGGGFVDVTGIQSQNSQSMFRAPARFYQYVNAWFDGYPLAVVNRQMMYLRNAAPGFSGLMSYEEDGTQGTIQLWPQTNRTGGTTTLAVAMGLTDSLMTVVDATQYGLSLGITQVDNEVVVYSAINGNQVTGLTRGVGGTTVATHAIGAPVTELNIRLSGRRLGTVYTPGQSSYDLNLPPGWEIPISIHMLSQVRGMEQQDDLASGLMKEFVSMAEKIAKDGKKGIKPRQISPYGSTGVETFSTHLGGGWLVS